MNIFVLTTGRTGSKTFARACRHIEGFSVGHESRACVADDSRLTYPDNHIEVDCRLAFFLGELSYKYGPSPDGYPRAGYIHLLRDEEAVASSFARRWEGEVNIAKAWKNSVLMGGSDCAPYEAALQYARATNRNIRAFMDRCNSLTYTVRLESIKRDFEKAVDFFGFMGGRCPDLPVALAEFDIVDAS